MNMKSKLLVVDDQPGIRLLLSDILENEGYTIDLARTGKEAIVKVEQNAYNLIILDYKLPIIDGKQVIVQLEAMNIGIPVILMSGLIENVDKNTKESQLVKAIVAKPFNIQDICKTVSNILRKNANAV
ncbi:response regulator [Virgibacillus sp. W0430]|uniref:response regulator n=1 Tax=Virgibacillus sp. W0430 TaxID=3391580 RepID=UPI003F4647FD